MQAWYTETLLHCPICILVPIFHALRTEPCGTCHFRCHHLLFSEMWVCSSAASCPPLLPLPSHCSHSPCGGVVGGGTEVVGVPSTSQVAAYHARDTLPHQQKVVCTAVPALVLHCVFCCAVSPDCPPYNTAPSPRTVSVPS